MHKVRSVLSKLCLIHLSFCPRYTGRTVDRESLSKLENRVPNCTYYALYLWRDSSQSFAEFFWFFLFTSEAACLKNFSNRTITESLMKKFPRLINKNAKICRNAFNLCAWLFKGGYRNWDQTRSSFKYSSLTGTAEYTKTCLLLRPSQTGWKSSIFTSCVKIETKNN